MRYYKYEWDKPDTYKPTTILFTFNEAGKEKLSAVKGWFKFPIKLMDANICL